MNVFVKMAITKKMILPYLKYVLKESLVIKMDILIKKLKLVNLALNYA